MTVAAQRIAAIHHATRDHRYTDDSNQLTLRPGALQLVFCDVSTPAGDGWNAYDELKSLLVRRGVEPGAIRYMQSAQTDQAKASLSRLDGTRVHRYLPQTILKSARDYVREAVTQGTATGVKIRIKETSGKSLRATPGRASSGFLPICGT